MEGAGGIRTRDLTIQSGRNPGLRNGLESDRCFREQEPRGFPAAGLCAARCYAAIRGPEELPAFASEADVDCAERRSSAREQSERAPFSWRHLDRRHLVPGQLIPIWLQAALSVPQGLVRRRHGGWRKQARSSQRANDWRSDAIQFQETSSRGGCRAFRRSRKARRDERSEERLEPTTDPLYQSGARAGLSYTPLLREFGLARTRVERSEATNGLDRTEGLEPSASTLEAWRSPR